MPVTLGCLCETFWDYSTIVGRVLIYDKVARRWFRNHVKEIILDKNGTTLGDFIMKNDKVNYKKVEEYNEYIRNNEDVTIIT